MRYLLLALAFITAGCEIRVIEIPHPHDEDIVIVDRDYPPKEDVIVDDDHSYDWCDDGYFPYGEYPSYCEEYWDGACCEWEAFDGCIEVWCQTYVDSCDGAWKFDSVWC